MKKEMPVSVIITTYNWPEALDRVLQALAVQSYSSFEVLIADDGSSEATACYIKKAKSYYALDIHHIWQPDEGFRAAKIRNKAVAVAKGDYLIFLDGDCIPSPHFISRHVALAEPGYWLTGNRILLSESFTHHLLQTKIALHQYTWRQWLRLWVSSGCNRILPLLFLPFYPRKWHQHKWQGAKTCNLGLWRKDFIAVNGLDESFVGWGYEDSDFIIRLIKLGINRKEGRYAVPVSHLWHKEQDRSLEHNNFSRFLQRITDETIKAPTGVDQYII